MECTHSDMLDSQCARITLVIYGNKIVEIRIKGVVRFGFAEGITNPAK